MSLNTRVHIVSKAGKKETLTVREVIDRGHGKAYEAMMMFDEWEVFVQDYLAEKGPRLEELKMKLKELTKEVEKARWWLEEGVYKEAKALARFITHEESEQAYREWKEFETELTRRLDEYTAITTKINSLSPR
jgi:hypothetical protein